MLKFGTLKNEQSLNQSKCQVFETKELLRRSRLWPGAKDISLRILEEFPGENTLS